MLSCKIYSHFQQFTNNSSSIVTPNCTYAFCKMFLVCLQLNGSTQLYLFLARTYYCVSIVNVYVCVITMCSMFVFSFTRSHVYGAMVLPLLTFYVGRALNSQTDIFLFWVFFLLLAFETQFRLFSLIQILFRLQNYRRNYLFKKFRFTISQI